MRHFGLATFLVWREYGDDVHRAVPKVSAVLLSRKWKHYETTNQHLQNKASLSALVIIINQQSRKKGSSKLCNAIIFSFLVRKKKPNWVHMLHSDLECDNGMAADKLWSDCCSNYSVIMKGWGEWFQFLLKHALVTNRAATCTGLAFPRRLVILKNWD